MRSSGKVAGGATILAKLDLLSKGTVESASTRMWKMRDEMEQSVLLVVLGWSNNLIVMRSQVGASGIYHLFVVGSVKC